MAITRKQSARKQLTAWRREQVLRHYGHRCAQCGQTNPPLEIDHIYPVARGGTNEMHNLQVLCRPCNAKKSDSIA